MAERGEIASNLIWDGNAKFTEKFDEIFKTEGIKVKKLPFRSPNLNAFSERWVQSAQNECLNHFVVFGERHLDHLLREYEDFYNTVRPHQGLGNRTIGVVAMPPVCEEPPGRPKSSATPGWAGCCGIATGGTHKLDRARLTRGGYGRFESGTGLLQYACFRWVAEKEKETSDRHRYKRGPIRLSSAGEGAESEFRVRI